MAWLRHLWRVLRPSALAEWITQQASDAPRVRAMDTRSEALLLRARDADLQLAAVIARAAAIESELGRMDQSHADQARVWGDLHAWVLRLEDRQREHERLTDELTASVRRREDEERREIWLARLTRFTPEQRAVLERVSHALESAAWGDARTAVRAVATTPGFHEPAMWLSYSRTLKAERGQAENVFRHVKAVVDLREAVRVKDGTLLSNPDAHLLIELAYAGFAAHPRG